jgi:hypothetical protein
VEEVIDFLPTREQAEETLKQVLEDEPGWADMLEVVEVELGSASENWRVFVLNVMRRDGAASERASPLGQHAGGCHWEALLYRSPKRQSNRQLSIPNACV